MKIAFIINHLGQTGVNVVVRDLVTVFTEHGDECCVFWLKPCEKAMSYGCQTERLVDGGQLKGYDVVHAHGLGPMLWVYMHGTPTGALRVTTLHCYCFQDFTDLYGRVKGTVMGLLFLFLARKFDRIVCLSKDMMSYYRRWLPMRRLSFVYNTRILPDSDDPVWTTDEVVERVRTFRGSSTLIGMNGVLIFRKGVDLMIGALRELVVGGHDVRLVLAGDGKERGTFEAMVREAGLEDRVLMLGMVKDAWRLLPEYDIFALPSRSEGFPLALLEAAAMGKKTVVSDLPIVRECFHDHRDVEMFSLADGSQGLAEALLRVGGNEKLGEELKKTFFSEYAPVVFYRRYAAVYKKTVESF